MSTGPRFPPPPPLLSQVLAQREPWQLENSPDPAAALGFGEGRRQRGAAPPPRQPGDPRGRAGGFSQLLSAAGGSCWLGGETRYPVPRLGGRGGRPHAERTPPDTLPGSRAGALSIRASSGQLRLTPPEPLRILRAVEYPPFTRGTGPRAPVATPDMSVGRFLMDSTPNPHFPSHKSASTASACGLSLRGVAKLLLMTSAPSVPLDLGEEGPAVLRAGPPCPRESREDAIAAGRARTWPGPGSGVEANPPVTSRLFPALPAPLF